MKIGGKTYEAKRTPISVPTLSGENVILTIEPLPPGFMEQEPEIIPEPKVPHRWATKPGNQKKLLRDQGKPIAVQDEENPRYQQARYRMTRARVARAIYTSLQNDDAVAFETVRSEQQSMTAYFYAIAEELEACGIGLGAQMTLFEAILELSGLNVKEAVDEGLGTFHYGTGDDADGGESAEG